MRAFEFADNYSGAYSNNQGYEKLLEAMRKERRLNNHVFSMLKARCPLEDKVAYAIWVVLLCWIKKQEDAFDVSTF